MTVPGYLPSIGCQSRGSNLPRHSCVRELVAKVERAAVNCNPSSTASVTSSPNIHNAENNAGSLCEDAEAQVQALGTKHASTVDAFNAALGFQTFNGGLNQASVKALLRLAATSQGLVKGTLPDA
ncbi:hypothetical protein QBC33DRAFT_158121 [Phialemonium atrogriseum]|uniref:Uncharacterized protein n=1 Tax=Phialemonium atrogriseum TaxID=1093897 RepID=A0AAJ0C7J9_9PEZI|nr:uncharacterized protein QBC33DRAFT_158121 [Phialemonium atrogriseum]KAK1771609.1 hypothetical protein QBC33DRAFT_158121 [Phialemonium atrogriseum]